MMPIFLFLVAALAPATVEMASNETETAAPLRVAAFNVQTFGVSKMSDIVVAERVAEIIQRSDIILIQEVRDISGEALEVLKRILGPDWNYVASDRIGRTSYKEQYVFFYRIDLVKVTGQYQFEDTDDVFEREPYAIEIQYYSARHSEFRAMALLGFHSKPDDTPSELGYLSDTIWVTYLYFLDSDGVIAMGDFNADCSYLNDELKDNLEIFKSTSGFTSLIDPSQDTTVSKSTHCAYDRAITFGEVDARDTKVFDFQTAMGLTDEEAKNVSDHYPIEFNLY